MTTKKSSSSSKNSKNVKKKKSQVKWKIHGVCDDVDFFSLENLADWDDEEKIVTFIFLPIHPNLKQKPPDVLWKTEKKKDFQTFCIKLEDLETLYKTESEKKLKPWFTGFASLSQPDGLYVGPYYDLHSSTSSSSLKEWEISASPPLYIQFPLRQVLKATQVRKAISQIQRSSRKHHELLCIPYVEKLLGTGLGQSEVHNQKFWIYEIANTGDVTFRLQPEKEGLLLKLDPKEWLNMLRYLQENEVYMIQKNQLEQILRRLRERKVKDYAAADYRYLFVGDVYQLFLKNMYGREKHQHQQNQLKQATRERHLYFGTMIQWFHQMEHFLNSLVLAKESLLAVQAHVKNIFGTQDIEWIDRRLDATEQLYQKTDQEITSNVAVQKDFEKTCGGQKLTSVKKQIIDPAHIADQEIPEQQQQGNMFRKSWFGPFESDLMELIVALGPEFKNRLMEKYRTPSLNLVGLEDDDDIF